MHSKDLLLQILMILVPIFTYQLIGAERVDKFKRVQKALFIFGISVIPMLLCMTFPISPISGYRFDFKTILIILGTLYGGPRAGIAMLGVYIFYRYQWGGVGIILSLMINVPSLILSIICYQTFQQSFGIKRITVAAMVLLLSLADSIFYYLFVKQSLESVLPFFGLFIFFEIITMILAVFLIENIRESALLKVRIQQTEKLRLLGDLTSAFAHEIRNPMQVNRGFLQLLEEESLTDRARGYIRICLDEMDRANGIITEYLTFAKPEAVDLEPIEMNQQVKIISNLISSYAIMNKVEIDLGVEEKCCILANSHKLKQSLINIFKNGIESMPRGGTLRISCDCNDQNVIISIADEGMGMTKDQLQRLGTPFYSLKEKGTGLGLMVAYRIIESFRGEVVVNSEVGEGTTFLLIFPRYSEEKCKYNEGILGF